jgi:hypothetical protein
MPPDKIDTSCGRLFVQHSAHPLRRRFASCAFRSDWQSPPRCIRFHTAFSHPPCHHSVFPPRSATTTTLLRTTVPPAPAPPILPRRFTRRRQAQTAACRLPRSPTPTALPIQSACRLWAGPLPSSAGRGEGSLPRTARGLAVDPGKAAGDGAPRGARAAGGGRVAEWTVRERVGRRRVGGRGEGGVGGVQAGGLAARKSARTAILAARTSCAPPISWKKRRRAASRT